MNDLTKEELEHILQLVNDYEYKCENEITDLPGKIQSMIENYCEHEWRRSAINAIYCPYCQKHVEYSE